jgi:hypothetical protein
LIDDLHKHALSAGVCTVVHALGCAACARGSEPWRKSGTPCEFPVKLARTVATHPHLGRRTCNASPLRDQLYVGTTLKKLALCAARPCVPQNRTDSNMRFWGSRRVVPAVSLLRRGPCCVGLCFGTAGVCGVSGAAVFPSRTLNPASDPAATGDVTGQRSRCRSCAGTCSSQSAADRNDEHAERLSCVRCDECKLLEATLCFQTLRQAVPGRKAPLKRCHSISF